MSFSASEILEEFVEASRTVRDWSSSAEASIYSRVMAERERAREYRADPWNKRRLRAWRDKPETRARALINGRRWLAKPENRAKNRARTQAYDDSHREQKRQRSSVWYHSGAGKEARRRWLAKNYEKRKAMRKESDAKYRAAKKAAKQ